MQRALLGIRQSQRGISTVASCKWSKATLHDQSLRKLLPTRRYISFPNFISHAPPSTATEDVAARPRRRGAQDDDDLSFSEALRRSIDKALSGQHRVTKVAPDRSSHEGPSLYGKWHSLSLDHERMLHEFDVNVSDSTMVRLIDQPGNEHDIQLWTCLIEFAHRHMGRDGVLMIWQSVSKRRNLFQVDGPLAPRFWKLVLEAAVSDDNFLRDVIDYADWLYRTHGVRWPDLYSTVMAHFLHTTSEGDQAMASREAALRWHSVLAESFGPSEDEFAVLLKGSGTVDRTAFNTLTSLYIENSYRTMYDSLIPHLYGEGNVDRAKQWRIIFIKANDAPVSLAARPFLRFLGGYYTRAKLTADELKVAGLVPNERAPDHPETQPAKTAIEGQNLKYIFNRAHGETFGITEKPYNDNLGAKWFASSWVSLDFALNVIYTMGVQAIGQLSLQSIALREEGAAGVLARLDQLRQLRIGLPETRYVKAIEHYAVVGDDESLQELLNCDIHPDLFDHHEAQQKLLSDCMRVGNWHTYRLVLKTILTAAAKTQGGTSNRMVESCIRQGNGYMMLKVMQEMASQQVELEPLVSHHVSSFILQSLSPHADKNHAKTRALRKHVDLHIRLAKQLAATRFPPAVQVWQVLLHRLGHEKRLGDLERLCFYILRMYTDHTTAEQQPMWNAHTADVPSILRFETPFPKFQRLPRGLPLRHEKHPLRQIFDSKLQDSIVRWGFFYTAYSRQAEGAAADVLNNAPDDEGPSTDDDLSAAAEGAPGAAQTLPMKFHIARGIRLLAMLRDKGLFVLQPTVRKQAELRLVDLFRGEGSADYKWWDGNPRLTALRRNLRFNLPEAKRLCDMAWGGKGELVSSLLQLERKIEGVERTDELKRLQRRVELMKNPELMKERGGRV